MSAISVAAWRANFARSVVKSHSNWGKKGWLAEVAMSMRGRSMITDPASSGSSSSSSSSMVAVTR